MARTPKTISMIKIISPFLWLALIACNEVTYDVIKCDYVSTMTRRNTKSYYSIIQYEKKDTVFQNLYFDIDSSFTIMNNRSFEAIEAFSDTAYFLYNSICLKKNIDIGKSWSSKHGQIPVTVILRKIEQKIIDGHKFEKCYIYEIKYNADSWTIEFSDCILYFDFDSKVVIQKDTYYEGRLIGCDKLEKINIWELN